jgi:hypothetical protein
MLYCEKTVGQQERAETYTNGVWSEMFNMENCNENNM